MIPLGFPRSPLDSQLFLRVLSETQGSGVPLLCNHSESFDILGDTMESEGILGNPFLEFGVLPCDPQKSP